MKDSYKIASILVLSLLFCLVAGSPTWANGPRMFILNQVKGQVVVVDKAGKKSAINGMKVGGLSEIITGANGSVKVITDEGGSITLAPNTKLTLKELKSGKDGKGKITVLKTWTGKVFLRTKKILDKNSRFQIETPTTIAGVRGTIWEVAYNSGETRVGVFQGAVGLNNRTTLTGLQRATSSNLQAPVQVAKITADDLSAWDGEQLSIAIKEVGQEINNQVRGRKQSFSDSELNDLQKQIEELKSLQSMVDEVYDLLGLPAPPALQFPDDVTKIIFDFSEYGNPSDSPGPNLYY